jgi:hypothetical protein
MSSNDVPKYAGELSQYFKRQHEEFRQFVRDQVREEIQHREAECPYKERIFTLGQLRSSTFSFLSRSKSPRPMPRIHSSEFPNYAPEKRSYEQLVLDVNQLYDSWRDTCWLNEQMAIELEDMGKSLHVALHRVKRAHWSIVAVFVLMLSHGVATGWLVKMVLESLR